MSKLITMHKICPICNKEFVTVGYQASKKITCSKECSIIYRSKIKNVDKIIELYKEGLSAMKIAKMHNVADVTILRILHINNVKIRSNNDPIYNKSKKKVKKEVKINYEKLMEKVKEIERNERSKY